MVGSIQDRLTVPGTFRKTVGIVQGSNISLPHGASITVGRQPKAEGGSRQTERDQPISDLQPGRFNLPSDRLLVGNFVNLGATPVLLHIPCPAISPIRDTRLTRQMGMDDLDPSRRTVLGSPASGFAHEIPVDGSTGAYDAVSSSRVALSWMLQSSGVSKSEAPVRVHCAWTSRAVSNCLTYYDIDPSIPVPIQPPIRYWLGKTGSLMLASGFLAS